jgi:hypothetical protein
MNKTKENSLLENFNTFKRHALTKTISTVQSNATTQYSPPVFIVGLHCCSPSIRQHFWPVSPTAAAAAAKKIFYFHFQA